ncbi:MAG: type III pantothenate kinase [Anaerolineae bacterium]|jgi:type III pantothenate kinase|nr:type III pantothenate kinase [Anaerolineae bacterium]
MLLAVDVGNTNIHLGLWNGERWALSWRARTVHDKMPDEYGVLVRNFLTSADVGFAAVHGVVIGSVVPPLTLAFTELVQRYFRLEPLVVNHTIKLGVTLALDQPEQAGADRVVNAAAVVALHGGGPAIVIDFGTATTFDVVSAKGEYRGGAICAGINVAHDALVSRAAKLHKVDLTPPPSPIGSNTIHAMQSGIFYGYVAMIEGLTARIKAQLAIDDPAHPNVRVIATGGLAPLLYKHTHAIDQIEPELTLDGLRVVYDLNAPHGRS